MDTDWRRLTRAAYVVAGHLDAAAGDDPHGGEGDGGSLSRTAARRRSRPPRAWWERRPARVVAAVLVLFASGVAVRGCAAQGVTPVDVPAAHATQRTPSTDPSGEVGNVEGGVDDAQGSSGAGSGEGARGAPPNSQNAGVLVVHVAGAVAAPGLVELPAGSRVGDAIAAAGGALPGAQVDAVNLARLVVDGEQVRVPAEGEDLVPAAAPSASGATGGVGAVGGGGAGASGSGGSVDLNTADAAALDALPGIGPALAARILEHRASIGGFTSVDELDDVSGIGPVVMERLRPLVTVK